MPQIPYRAQPSKGVRRTILPQFYKVYLDSNKIEIEESGNFNELSTTYRDLIPRLSSLSGYTNIYRAILYRFPTAIKIESLGVISDCLIGQRRQTDPIVRKELEKIFRLDSTRLEEYLRTQRFNAINKFKLTFKDIKALKQERYPKEKSFFTQKGDQNKLPPLDILKEISDKDESELSLFEQNLR